MIALIDCNNFYCSCERVFDPKLIGKPLIVLSNNDGCAISRSEEAKELGINMGTPAFMIEALIKQHDVQVRSSNYTLYGDMSERVMQIIKTYASKIEVYSIDEIFVDFSDCKYHDLENLGIRIREEVGTCTGIPVCVGIAPTKALAKMANRYAKKRKREVGVHFAANDAASLQMLEYTEVENIWGIGKQYAKLLRDHGFCTAADLLRVPDEWIRKNMSVVGQRLVAELKGMSCIKWEAAPPPKKAICTSRSFAQVLSDRRTIQQAIAAHTSTCGSKLRKEGSCAKKLHVFIQTNPHRGADEQYFGSVTLQLPVASSSGPELIKYAMKALEQIYRPGYFYQKAGVILMDLIPDSAIQMGMFDDTHRKRDAAIMKSVDGVNKVFGRERVRFGVQEFTRKWKLKAERLSPCYTTRLTDIPKAKAN
ncbi:MAG TPA: Y-family DNA polymerase [Flavisolibacter sp.]